MADPTNTVSEQQFSRISGPFAIADDQVALVPSGAGAQATALRVTAQQFCVTKAVATGAVILPSISNGNDAPGIFVIINETLVSINVGTTPGDTITVAGVATATAATFATGIIAVPSKSSAIFLSSGSPFGKRGQATASNNNWIPFTTTA